MEYVDIKKALRAALDDKAITVIAHPGEFNSFEIAKSL